MVQHPLLQVNITLKKKHFIALTAQNLRREQKEDGTVWGLFSPCHFHFQVIFPTILRAVSVKTPLSLKISDFKNSSQSHMVKKVFKDIVKNSIQKTGAKLLFFNRSENISCKHLGLKLGICNL